MGRELLLLSACLSVCLAAAIVVIVKGLVEEEEDAATCAVPTATPQEPLRAAAALLRPPYPFPSCRILKTSGTDSTDY